MLNFQAVREKQLTFQELVADLTVEDLRRLTNEMIDTMLGLIADCDDAAVTFQPIDENAHDTYAADAADTNLAWTLGHVIVHATASAEEAAFLAAEMARGVQREGRSRSEVSWQTVTTLAQCRHRLEESRRMRLASLDIWPDEPYLNNTRDMSDAFKGINAIGRFVLGLRHDHAHLGQIADIVQQARAANHAHLN